MVRSAIAADSAYLTTIDAQLNANLVVSVQSELKPDEVRSLLGFFDSPTGAQYLELQTELHELFASGMREILTHVSTQQPFAPLTDKTPVLKQRLQTLTLGTDVIRMQQRARAAAQTGRDVSAHAGDGLVITQIAEDVGGEGSTRA